MFAYCQWCRKSPSPFTAGLWWPALFPVRHLRRENRKIKAKGPIASRSLHSLTGGWGQPHYTVVSSEVIHVKVETKSPFFEKYKCLVEPRTEIPEDFYQETSVRLCTERPPQSDKQHH